MSNFRRINFISNRFGLFRSPLIRFSFCTTQHCKTGVEEQFFENFDDTLRNRAMREKSARRIVRGLDVPNFELSHIQK